MNRNRLFIAICLPALLLAAGGCTQDELAGDGTQLPEGKYPLQIASVSLSAEVTDEPWGASQAPQTRVAENSDGNSSKWENGDKIHVLINGGGFADEELVCTLDADGQVKEYSKTLYWKDTSPATYTAWYDTAGQDGKVDLSDQSQNLAYVLTCEGNAGYNTQMDLKFTHALAKVRVIVEGSKAENVEEVKILSYPQCTDTQGKVEGLETKDYITMHHQNGTMIWEANVVAEQLSSEDLNKYVKLITTTGSEKIVPITLNNALLAGKINEIRIKAKVKPVTITGDCEIKGNSAPIIIKGSPKITFDGATITTDDTQMYVIEIKSGNPTLIFKGENVLQHDFPEYTSKYVIYSDREAEGFKIQLENNAKLAIIAKETSPIFIGSGTLSISGNGELYLDGKRNYSPAIQCENKTKLDIQGVTLTAISRQANVSLGTKVPGQNFSANINIYLQNCKLNLYANNGNESFWVYTGDGGQGTITSNGVNIDVNSSLKDINWDTEVATLGTGVKATKLQNAPDIPDWAKK